MRISWSKKEKENIKGKRQTITLKINRHQVKYVSKINFINLHNTWKNWLFSLKERDHQANRSNIKVNSVILLKIMHLKEMWNTEYEGYKEGDRQMQTRKQLREKNQTWFFFIKRKNFWLKVLDGIKRL